MDPITLLGLIAPLFVKGGSALISRFIAPKEFRPSTIDEWTKMQQVDMERFKALNEAGGSNPTYLWVEAIVRLQRPFVVALTLIVWASLHLLTFFDPALFITAAPIASGAGTPALSALQSLTVSVDNAAAIIGFYLFGERTMFGVPNAGSNGITSTAAVAAASKPTLAPAGRS